MNYGLYLSATGILTSMHRQDVAANNLANASTTGFKRALATFRERLPASAELPDGADAAQPLLDRLGGGFLAQPTRIVNAPGTLHSTGNDLDFAVQGSGFFAVKTNDEKLQLTRDGRFSIGDGGRLVTQSGGSVLDAFGNPIVLKPGVKVTADADGNLRQGRTVIAQLDLLDVGDGSNLTAVGGGLYDDAGAVKRNQRATGSIRQGTLEESNADPIREMMEMLDSTREVSYHATMIHYQDDLMDKAVNVLGRVA